MLVNNFGWTETRLKSNNRNYKGNTEIPPYECFKFKVIKNLEHEQKQNHRLVDICNKLDNPQFF